VGWSTLEKARNVVREVVHRQHRLLDGIRRPEARQVDGDASPVQGRQLLEPHAVIEGEAVDEERRGAGAAFDIRDAPTPEFFEPHTFRILSSP
jgi:hypothetical protein